MTRGVGTFVLPQMDVCIKYVNSLVCLSNVYNIFPRVCKYSARMVSSVCVRLCVGLCVFLYLFLTEVLKYPLC